MNIFMRTSVMIGLVLVSPLIFISLFFIFIEDGRPTLFLQERLGKNKKNFTLYKIRTMYKSAPNLGTHQVDTSNYLFFGTLLRKIKIDELPQLINYLKGDLTLVGPRPGLVNQIELKEYRDFYNIFNVKPGITGLAQILGYDMSNPKLLAKIDNLYIKNKSTALDAKIFFGTFIKPIRSSIYLKFKDEIEEIIK